MRKIDEERLAFIFLHEGDGLVRVTLGQGSHVGLRLDQFLVPVEVHDRVVACRRAEKVIEPLACGKQVHEKAGLRVSGQVPLAETSRGIALGLQYFGDRYFLVVEHGMDVLDVASFRHPHGLATRHEGGSRRSADRLGVKTCETHALLGHAVYSWGANVLGSEAPCVAVAHVVGENQYEVGMVGLREESCCQSRQ